MVVTTISCRDGDSNDSMIEVKQKKVCLYDISYFLQSVMTSGVSRIIETEKYFHHMKFSKKLFS